LRSGQLESMGRTQLHPENGFTQIQRFVQIGVCGKPETDGMSEVVSLVDVEDALEAAGVKYK